MSFEEAKKLGLQLKADIIKAFGKDEYDKCTGREMEESGEKLGKGMIGDREVNINVVLGWIEAHKEVDRVCALFDEKGRYLHGKNRHRRT